MSSEEIVVASPFDGHEIGRVPKSSADDVDHAVQAATRTLRENPISLYDRAAILDKAAVLLADRVEEFAHTIAEEAAKPIKTARLEAQRAVSTFQFAAVAARDLTGEMVPLDASDVGGDKLAFTLRVPIGVIGAITPFNFPLNLVAHKLAPAIAAGCPVILKPASQTPFSALKLADLLKNKCGLPDDYLHVVTGSGSEIGNALVDHPDIAMITFTGSPPVGWDIRARAPRKKVSLELGNNAPVIIEPDADWETAVTKLSVAGFSYAGQSCISSQRVYVHEQIAAEFEQKLIGKVNALVTGDPMDEQTDVSALITTDDRERVVSWVQEAISQGAELLTGGEIENEIMRPTILGNVSPDMKVCREEVFGPVLAIQHYSTFEEAIALANDTKYGLQAGVFTQDLTKSVQAARQLNFGGVLINEVPTWRADLMPYGGVQESGNTKEGPKYAVEEMTQERLVVIQT